MSATDARRVLTLRSAQQRLPIPSSPSNINCGPQCCLPATAERGQVVPPAWARALNRAGPRRCHGRRTRSTSRVGDWIAFDALPARVAPRVQLPESSLILIAKKVTLGRGARLAPKATPSAALPFSYLVSDLLSDLFGLGCEGAKPRDWPVAALHWVDCRARAAGHQQR